MATKNQAIEIMVISAIADNGELAEAEIVALVQENEEEAEETAIRRMIVKLDRDGKITRANTDSGFQITATGTSALDGLRAKMEARYIAPYTDWGQVEAVYHFISPTLGPLTDPGGVGISRFPRIGEVVEYVSKTATRKVGRGTKTEPVTERVVKSPGQPVMYGGWILTALQKAADKTEATVTIDRAGIRRVLPDAAWSRVSIKRIMLPLDQQIVKAVRRPTNIRGQAIGEIVHEALPSGTTITIRGSFPLSHFSEQYIVAVLSTLEDVGISAAGTGKGGIWGVGYFSSVKINGREVWPHAQDVSNSIQSNGATAARDMLQSTQQPVTALTVQATPADAVRTSARTEASEPDRADLVLGNGITSHSGVDPRDRLKAGATVTTVNGNR